MIAAAFGEVLNFPCSVKFRFIGENSGELHDNVRKFFTEDLRIVPAEIAPGRISKNGRYLTLNVTVEVSSEDMMNTVYREGARVPLVVHVL
ncbi:DUF493 domain-containing protein [Succinimonas amylolytica]|uniref:DUF493 domain-containing protein n=1 Tax=Succinimonas amylolytica TaxID=83769 RepID=UPI000369231B|nr:DUF493 domain-containing protein [Succinimonas amylolytica]